MNYFVNWLKRPYPTIDSFEGICAISLVLGIVVGAILILFQPFGIREMPTLKLLTAGGFGIVTTMTTLGFLALLHVVPLLGYRDQKWSVGRQILFLNVLLFLITLGNWQLNNAIAPATCSAVFSLGQFYGITLQVGIVPLLVSIFFTEKLIRRSNVQTAHHLNEELHSASVEENQSTIPVSADRFLFARSEGNYLQIYTTDTAPLVLRITMKELESLYENHPNLLRCHRSFMVNRAQIVTVEGNAGGLVLQLSNGEKVPVSRSYVPGIKKILSIHRE